jgi:hypothetical protein
MKIGGREILHTSTLIVAAGEDAWIEFPIGNRLVRINVIFRVTPPEQGKTLPAGIHIEQKGDYGELVLSDWSNPLGTATKRPVELATTEEGTKVYLMIWHTQVGEAEATARLDLQFSAGVAE